MQGCPSFLLLEFPLSYDEMPAFRLGCPFWRLVEHAQVLGTICLTTWYGSLLIAPVLAPQRRQQGRHPGLGSQPLPTAAAAILTGQHSFEKGQGKTGGIMDYGDGQLHRVDDV